MKHVLDSRTYFKKSLTTALIFGSKSKSSMIMSTTSPNVLSIEQPVENCERKTPKNHGRLLMSLPFMVTNLGMIP